MVAHTIVFFVTGVAAELDRVRRRGEHGLRERARAKVGGERERVRLRARHGGGSDEHQQRREQGDT